MLTMAPRRSMSVGSRRWVISTSAVTLVSIICRHCAVSQAWAGAVPSASPALFTSRSTPRKGPGRASIAAAMAVASRMSKQAVCTRSRPRRSASASRRSWRRPVATARQPLATKRSTMAAPKPAVAPVTSRVFMARILRPRRGSLGADGERLEAAVAELLLRLGQLGRAAVGPHAHPVERAALDLRRLHAGHQAEHGDARLQRLGIGAAGEGAGLQDVARAVGGGG